MTECLSRRPTGFAEGAIPPYSLADYVAKLFTDPPSNYRQLVFVLTDEANFGMSDQSNCLLSQRAGIRFRTSSEEKLQDKYAYVLVYAWGRRNGETARPVNGLSAETHLAESGVLKALQN